MVVILRAVRDVGLPVVPHGGGPMSENDWWFNLRTQVVEQGGGDPNSERLGPYATRAEAEGVLDRMRARNESFDAQDDE
jgi:hypothetical protein